MTLQILQQNLEEKRVSSPYMTGIYLSFQYVREVPDIRSKIETMQYRRTENLLKEVLEKMSVKLFSLSEIMDQIKRMNQKEPNRGYFNRNIDIIKGVSVAQKTLEERMKKIVELPVVVESTLELLEARERKIQFIREDMNGLYSDSVNLFLNSDLDPSFLRIIDSDIFWELGATGCYENIGESFRNKILEKPASGRFSRQQYDNCMRRYTMEIRDIERWAGKVEKARNLLMMYVDISNCKKVEDIMRVKRIKRRMLVPEVYEEFLSELNKSVNDLKKHLLRNYSTLLEDVKITEDERFVDDFITQQLLEA